MANRLRRLRPRPPLRPLLIVLGMAATAVLGPAAAVAATGGSSLVAVTWTAEATSNATSQAQGPPGLSGATAAYDGSTGTTVMFGGMTAAGTVSDQTWMWNEQTSSWTLVTPVGQVPPPRELASMAFDPRIDQLILFGGVGADHQLLNDTWAWNGQSWWQISDPTQPAPPPREGASLAYDSAGNLVLFGGTGYSGGNPPDTNPTTTIPSTTTTVPDSTTVAPTTTAPAPSTSTTPPSTAPIQNSQSLIALGDTWLWNGSTWSQSAATGPSPRSGAAMTYDASNGTTVLFGGQSGPAGTADAQLLGDTWLWVGSSWVAAHPKSLPPARYGAALVEDPPAGGPVLFGGEGATGGLIDTWRWNGSSWAATGVYGTSGVRVYPAASFDPARGRVLAFGGMSSTGAVDTTTFLQIGEPSPAAAPATTPSPTETTTSTTLSHPSGAPTTTFPAAPLPSTIVVTPAQSSPSGASIPPRTSPVLKQGSIVVLAGKGFKPDSTVTISFHSTPVLLGHTEADSTGAIKALVTVPTDAAPGAHHLIATGIGPNGKPAELEAAIDVAAFAPRQSTSAYETAVLVIVALMFPLATWVGLSASARRRRYS